MGPRTGDPADPLLVRRSVISLVVFIVLCIGSLLGGVIGEQLGLRSAILIGGVAFRHQAADGAAAEAQHRHLHRRASEFS